MKWNDDDGDGDDDEEEEEEEEYQKNGTDIVMTNDKE